MPGIIARQKPAQGGHQQILLSTFDHQRRRTRSPLPTGEWHRYTTHPFHALRQPSIAVTPNTLNRPIAQAKKNNRVKNRKASKSGHWNLKRLLALTLKTNSERKGVIKIRCKARDSQRCCGDADFGQGIYADLGQGIWGKQHGYAVLKRLFSFFFCCFVLVCHQIIHHMLPHRAIRSARPPYPRCSDAACGGYQ